MLQTQQILQGRYQLHQPLGQSPSRITWLATDLHSNEPVVVKLLTFSDQVQWDNLRLFEREAQILKQLNHPQIPQYRDYFCLDDRLLWFGLVQQYVPGRSLKQVLREGKRFNETDLVNLAESILQILVYLHGLSPPVLHRDIKPSNLILGDDHQVYLIDFGAVQDKAAAEGATFTVVGTYGYTPLEQFGGRASPASDLYALGATLIHLATGIPPADLPHLDSRIQVADSATLNPGMVRWLAKLTEPNLDRRFQKAQQALDSLKKLREASSSLLAPKPKGSSIKLLKSPERLHIKISPRWNRFKVLTFLSFLYLSVGSAQASLLAWQDLLMYGQFNFLALWLVLPAALFGWGQLLFFLSTEISFDQQHFEIQTQLFGFCLRRQRGRVIDIDRVFINTNILPGLVLGSGINEYAIKIFDQSFDPGLTKDEFHWLYHEIVSWLGFDQES